MTDAFGGTPLPPVSTSSLEPLKVWYDSSISFENAQQPHAQQVAAFEAVPNELNQAVLDVNQHFLVYAVKNGLLRVLHRSSSARSLLRGHVSKVTDINFFQNGDVLGTVGGNVIIWRLFYNSPEILSEKLLEIPCITPSLTGMTRLIWHPFNPNQFWLLLDNSANVKVATLVETTRITTITSEQEGESHAVCQLYNNTAVMDGAVLIQNNGGNMNDLSWSGKDTKHVLTCHDDGTIRLWNVKKLGDPTEQGLAPAECVVTIPSEEAVTRCMFLPHDNIVAEQDEEGLTSAFLTASRDNSVLTLWSAFYAHKHPTKLQTFGIQSSPSTSYNINLAYGPASPNQAVPNFFVLLSDRSSGKVYTVHLNTVWSRSPPKRALMVGLDYVVPFSLKYPIYSWSIACVAAENVEEDETPASGLNFDIRFFAYQSKMVQQYTLPHYMCLPPTSQWSMDTPGVQVDSLSMAPSVGVKQEQVAMQDYDEEYEVEEVDEEEDNDDLQPPEASSLPVPDGLGGGGGGTTSNAVDSTSNNPFANWLGAIAAKTPSGASGSVPPPPTPTTSTSSAAVSSDDLTKAVPMPSMEPTMLLNPAELLSSAGSMRYVFHCCSIHMNIDY